jgi:hypothetical protein
LTRPFHSSSFGLGCFEQGLQITQFDYLELSNEVCAFLRTGATDAVRSDDLLIGVGAPAAAIAARNPKNKKYSSLRVENIASAPTTL